MSATPSAMMNTSKKAVHVKWAGKTIALGTFPSAEADEKCARAKALTRAWRSTMRPKPTRDWVMLELERLGVRVVSGRLGRKAGDDDDADKKNGGVPPPVARNNSLGWGAGADLDALMQRRNSSLGLSMMNDSEFKRRSSLNSLGPALGLDTGIDPTMPPHRPLVGGGAAAAYEAARADHYQQKREEQQRRASSLGLGMGGGMGGGGMPQMGLSVNPNQHYEMLKLHHMNLLNEIQETTLMMNLYQQQQLQQQQQQLQQQQVTADVSGGNDQMSMLLQQQQGSSGAGAGGMDFNTRGSLGLGTLGAPSSGITSSSQASGGDQLSMMRQPQSIPSTAATPAPTPGSANGGAGPGADIKNELMKGQQEQAELEAKLQKLRDDIAKRKKEADELEASASGDKKRENEESEDPSAKRQKTEDDVAAKIM
mmetsp:Transcript_38474/g.93078  ORF Transcript_38474/g.93078 Transcript_38474/m.93078 type:complete len:425 (-) Transcript_38474:105-1379(-)|eukprot:CAMPEP_0113622028 /NCGR_PEP_ID=MMETSP0017_2-20120614/11276_1 /TAXON_ID=2856 /ORGANISM="Cylindrotheca closterium" /LENGTH=424 /DNA_ID=CAMNT_0000531825 /DNA_START=242 /DNA_END=1516 /DNA_ORIENTATION=+ /assembly_acc=CAM_ASM_000147